MNARKKNQKKKKADLEHQQDKLDQALDDSFPASDPVQLTEPKPSKQPERHPRYEPPPVQGP
ncbi:MAG: hypothetical protein JNK82_07695 [Myxococcaceae bacterium]|nr:hypothetical protein [Myxococcaceae bacterium]